MLDGLCLVASAGPSEDEFDYESAVEFWHAKANRRVSLFSLSKRHAGATPLFQIDADDTSAADTEIQSDSDEEYVSWQI